MAFVQLNTVSIHFPIYNFNARSLKQQFLRLALGGDLYREENKMVVQALNKITLQLKHGDRVGLIGHNGAGKSTFLRVLAKIYEPSAGTIQIEGKVCSLLNVMLGIHPESTGYENILVRGLLLGLTRKEIRNKMDDIAQFTELGDYLFTPVRSYSAGMQLRLAFAVATCIQPDILLMDELIEVGDSAFLKKAQTRLSEFIDQSSLLVLATHSNETIRKFCNKVILLEKGQLIYFGEMEKGFILYEQLNHAPC
ncbi:ABC transporter ATP-binding protein [Rickettsiella massiliensis]|uniref:ABC transporter ATP-binding protein n=1 Tax=Rickettsiella massiliensis TaxID=676517 RepID=UPI00029AA678|nr:ABC transporter ATP-binding protein [Rickettsiella massiliensis]